MLFMNKKNDHFPKKISINYMGKKVLKNIFPQRKKKNSILFEGITKLKFGAHSEWRSKPLGAMPTGKNKEQVLHIKKYVLYRGISTTWIELTIKNYMEWLETKNKHVETWPNDHKNVKIKELIQFRTKCALK